MVLMDAVNMWVWRALRPYLPPGTVLTSVFRPPQAQLDFIVRTARRHGYRFPRPPSLADRASWQEALEFIRGRGYKVASPGNSAHQRGIAYDLAGPNLQRIYDAVLKAADDGRIRLVRGSRSALIIEKANGCVHAEIDAAMLDEEPFVVV